MDIVDGTIGFKNMLDGILLNVTWMLMVTKGMVRWSGRGERYLQTSNFRDVDMGVSKNKGTPKWMVYNGQPY